MLVERPIKPWFAASLIHGEVASDAAGNMREAPGPCLDLAAAMVNAHSHMAYRCAVMLCREVVVSEVSMSAQWRCSSHAHPDISGISRAWRAMLDSGHRPWSATRTQTHRHAQVATHCLKAKQCPLQSSLCRGHLAGRDHAACEAAAAVPHWA